MAKSKYFMRCLVRRNAILYSTLYDWLSLMWLTPIPSSNKALKMIKLPFEFDVTISNNFMLGITIKRYITFTIILQSDELVSITSHMTCASTIQVSFISHSFTFQAYLFTKINKYFCYPNFNRVSKILCNVIAFYE